MVKRRTVLLGGAPNRESTPFQRIRQTVSASLHFILPIGHPIFRYAAIRPSYRLYFDDWGVVGHTPELRTFLAVGPTEFRLTGRYYAQSAASFWSIDRSGAPLHPHTNYFVGGNTKFYGAALFRLRREDFGEIRHHGGVSPAWPIEYDELEPYYDAFEYDIGASGVAGNLRGEIQPEGNPFEGPRSRPYPLPPLVDTIWGTKFADAARNLGYHPFPQPSGILSEAIYLFREGIFNLAADRRGRIDEEELREQIRVTILHELGHHHGLDEDDLAELGYD